MEPSITYGQLWLLIRYRYWLLNLLSTLPISRWTFQEHIENASTVLSQSVATIDRSVGHIMTILNHSMYFIAYLLFVICLDVCRYRKKSGGLVDTLGKMVRRQDYDSYTELEMHAELVRMALWCYTVILLCYTAVIMLYVIHNNRCMVQVYAECLLLKAMLTVCEDETLVSFVRAGLKVRQCYISFR